MSITDPQLLNFIVDRVGAGIFVVDRSMRIVLWNNFMSVHSGLPADLVIGQNLFEQFPELPRGWLEKKIKGVFILKNYAFTSWEQRPYLFQWRHTRPITGGLDHMQQNCTFLPVKNSAGEVQYVCVTLFDVTDTAVYERKLKDAITRLEESSSRDGLTGVFNRRYFESQMLAEVDRQRRYGGALSLIMIDIDHFKRVNDTHGHLGGDEVLKTIAGRIQGALRSSDVLARYGGEEMAVIAPGIDVNGGAILAERIRAVVAGTPVSFEGKEITVTVSLGVAEALPGIRDPQALIHAADEVLYLSKSNGRNRATCAAPVQPEAVAH